MPWVKIDDQFLTHPKALAAGKDGRALFIAALCHSAAHLTDGIVARTSLPTIAAAADVRGPSTAARLVAVGLWHEHPDGWEIHDYHDHNPTSDDVKAQRELVSRRRSEAGKRGAAKRWGNGKADSKPMANADSQNGKAVAPSPSPSLIPPSPPIAPPTETPPNVAGAGAPTDDDNPTTRTVEAALDHMAQCDLHRARAEGQPIRQPAAWTRTARTNRANAHRHDLTVLAAGQPGIDPVDLAEQIDLACGPLDGGTARAQRRWEREQAEGEAADRQAAETRARRRRADQTIARLRTDDPQRLAELEAQADAALDPDLTVGRKTLALQKLRQLVLDTEETPER